MTPAIDYLSNDARALVHGLSSAETTDGNRHTGIVTAVERDRPSEFNSIDETALRG